MLMMLRTAMKVHFANKKYCCGLSACPTPPFKKERKKSAQQEHIGRIWGVFHSRDAYRSRCEEAIVITLSTSEVFTCSGWSWTPNFQNIRFGETGP